MRFIDQIHRIERIDQLIRLKATGNPSELALKIGISESQLYEVLNIMKKELGGPILYSKILIMKQVSRLSLNQMRENFSQIPSNEVSTFYGGSDNGAGEPYPGGSSSSGSGMYTCLFSAISHASGMVGSAISTDEVVTQFTQVSGFEALQLVANHGFSADGATMAVEDFFDVTYIGYGSSLEDFLASNNSAIIAIDAGNGNSHAVNATSMDVYGNINYYDPESGTWGTVHSSEVQYAIGINGCL